MKALLAHGDVPRRARLDAVNQFFAYGYVPRGEAMLESIHKLPQGHALSYDVRADQLAAWPYWTLPDPPAARRRWRSEGDFCEELHTLLKDSVRRQLVADVPVGILLSGGIDSSLVTAVASEVSSSRVKTFTISFPGHGEFDEAAHARLVADHFGTEHHEMVAEPTSVDLLPRLAEQFDEPLGDSSMVPTYLVSKMIRREAKVALGGDGGDELFGGYAHHLTLSQEDRVRRFVPAPMRNAIGGAASRLPAGMRGRQRILRFAADLSRNLVRVNQFFDAEQRANLLKPLWQSLDGRGGDPETFRAALSSRSHSALQRATRVDFLTYLCDDILAKVDRASMLTSLEVRAPLLDHRIIEFAFGRIPDSLRAANRERKILLRALGRKLLPPALDLNRKQGFTVPFDDWFRGEWGGFIEEVLLQADPAIFDRDVIARLIREQRDRLSHRQRLFALTMFELWRRRYGISVTA